MKANKLFFCTLSLFCFLILLAAGCSNGGKLENSAPSDLKLSADKTFVSTGGTIRLSGSAVDADGDTLIYRWKASGGSGSTGTFVPSSGAGQVVSWIAPSQPGPVTITLTVTDEIEKTSKGLDVDVCIPIPTTIRSSTAITGSEFAYILTNPLPLRIGEDFTLNIGPGVTIIVDSEVGGFECYGRIAAQGTSEQRIRIVGNSAVEANVVKALSWDRIDIAGQVGAGVFGNVLVAGANIAFQAEEGATLTLESCEATGSAAYGVSVAFGSVATIHSCSIWDNEVGVYVLNSQVNIQGSSIRYSATNGLELSASDTTRQVVIENCEIANHNYDCIVLKDRVVAQIHDCSVFSAGEVQNGQRFYCLRLFADYTDADTIHAENNFWGTGNTSADKISQLIYDKGANSKLGAYVSFTPWLDARPSALETRATGGR